MTSEKQPHPKFEDQAAKQQEKSLLWELFFNLCLPTLILMKGHIWFPLSPKASLAIAIACPLSYGILDWVRDAHFNWIAFLGLISIAVKGSVGLFEGSNQWLAINEMMLPLIMGCTLVIFRLLHRPPFLPKFLLNEQFCYVENILQKIKKKGNESLLQKHILWYEWSLAGLFFFSAILNYLLARYLVIHPAGSAEFNHELGLLTGWSFVIIAVPATLGLLIIVWRFFSQIKKLSELSWEEILKN